MNRFAAALCRSPKIPLSLRRKVGRLFVPFSGEPFTIQIDGRPYSGRLDNTIEWVVFVTGQYYEYTYLNLVRGFGLSGRALDVGGNVGNHAVALAGIFEEVISVEPYPPLFERLREKTEGLPWVRAHNVAFGAATGVIGFSPPRGRNLGTGRVGAGGEVEVRVVRGDDFLASEGVGRLAFVKVDVEGYEAEVLAGLRETLRRDRPVVFYEAPRAFGAKGLPSLEESFSLFPEGYGFWGLRGQTTLPLQRSVARPVPIGARNTGRRFAYVVAAPRERRIPGLAVDGADSAQ
jgi:FkbM family methyltransferase